MGSLLDSVPETMNNYPVLSFSYLVSGRVFYVADHIQILLRRQNSSSPCGCACGTPRCSTAWPHTVRNLFSQYWHKTKKDRYLRFMNGEQRHTEMTIRSIQEFQVLNWSIKNLSFLNGQCVFVYMDTYAPSRYGVCIPEYVHIYSTKHCISSKHCCC